MPLEKIEQISEGRLWALWKIEESAEELMQLLKPEGYDLSFLYNISNYEKKREWLASRLTIKALVNHIGEEYSGTYCDEYGKPYLNNCPFFISLSHSKTIAAAILCKKAPVGIDAEVIGPKLNHIAPRVLNPIELANSLNLTPQLCVYWCVKEVVYKLHGKKKISLRDNILIHPFVLENEGLCKSELNHEGLVTVYNVKYLKVDNHIIAFNL